MQKWIPGVALFAVIGVLGGAAVRGLPSPETGPAEAVLAAPAEAAPSPAAVTANVAELRADLTRLITNTGWSGDRWSVMVVSLDRNDTLFAHNPDVALAPASNMKLFTTAAALYYLGPHFRYGTFLLADGTVQDSVLRGDLVLYGTGDPTISSRFGNMRSVWQAFADTLTSLGIRHVTGDVVGDASYFNGPGTPQGWQDNYMNASYAAPSSALSYAENVARLQIRPAAQAGWRPTVTLATGGNSIALVNEATTTASGRSSISVSRAGYEGPVIVRGRIARSSGVLARAVPISDPARLAASALVDVLQKSGITVGGGVRAVSSAAESPVTGRSVFAPALEQSTPLRVLAIHNSPPLIEILEIINKKSHNLMAEQTLRTIGRVATGSGSIEAGAQAVTHMLQAELGETPLALQQFDGSGLSLLNRTSARTMVNLLGYVASSPMWERYWFTLPEAGAPGGLRRMYRTPAEGNLRAKTGTINKVSALSGYVSARNGERLAFAIFSNDVPSTWRAKRIEDAIGARIAAFDRPREGGAEPTAPVAAPADAPKPAAQPASPAATEVPATAAARTHTIQQGDTFDGIAKKYGLTVRALRAANPGLNPRRLIPGRTMKLPPG